jgi:hypothetical protein
VDNVAFTFGSYTAFAIFKANRNATKFTQVYSVAILIHIAVKLETIHALKLLPTERSSYFRASVVSEVCW